MNVFLVVLVFNPMEIVLLVNCVLLAPSQMVTGIVNRVEKESSRRVQVLFNVILVDVVEKP